MLCRGVVRLSMYALCRAPTAPSGGRELRVRHGAGQRNIGANIANNFEKAAIARVFFDTTAVYA